AVADLGDGDDDGGVGADRLLQLAAQTRDVRVDGAAVQVQIDAIVPDAREQLIARYHALAVLEEIHQQIELFRRELELLIARACFARRWIQLDERVFADRFRGGRDVRASHDRV